MTEEKVLLLEHAVNGLIKEVHDLRDRVSRALDMKWAMETFRRKMKAEAYIKRQIKHIIPALQKIDLGKLGVFYDDLHKFKKALAGIEKVIEELSYY